MPNSRGPPAADPQYGGVKESNHVENLLDLGEWPDSTMKVQELGR